jgi:hypothetical protein
VGLSVKVMNQIIQLRSAAVEESRSGVIDRANPSVRTDAVYVVFTSIDDTLAAVRVASDLAKAMAVPLTVIHFRAVPYALSVDRPDGLSPVETDGFVNRLRAAGLDTRVRIYLCRSAHRAIPMAFKEHSLVVMAGRRRRWWWLSRSERWRRALEMAGHFVVFVDGAQHKERSDA